MPPPPTVPGGAALPAPQLTLTATSTSAADYVLQVPYDASSLADVSAWHLPGSPPRPPPPTQTPSNSAPTYTLNPELALYKAFHHILTNPTREPGAPSPARHRVAMGLLTHSALVPRWELPDTMYAASAPAPPRAWPIVPTFAVPISKNSSSSTTSDPAPPRRFPPTHRTVAAPDRLAPLVGAQGSRLPELARRVLPPAVYARVTKLAHPPPLARNNANPNAPNAKLNKYGPGVPAPWNATSASVQNNTADGEASGGKGAAGEKTIPDARVYATWEYETKDFRAPLPVRRPRAGGGGGAGGQPPHPPQPARRSSRAVG
ncbi:hypothetical protein K438DRAFT_1981333 [Mycena galopus ATCC 62051]|nr:hypothetical protein K438DRAFT_1981333 [Mycena galopus ATCC 62051]